MTNVDFCFPPPLCAFGRWFFCGFVYRALSTVQPQSQPRISRWFGLILTRRNLLMHTRRVGLKYWTRLNMVTAGVQIIPLNRVSYAIGLFLPFTVLARQPSYFKYTGEEPLYLANKMCHSMRIVSFGYGLRYYPGKPECLREHNLLSESLWERSKYSLPDSPGAEH